MQKRSAFSDKIRALFAYRRIPWMLRLSSIEDHGKFVARMYQLQEDIYALDKYLESHWAVQKSELQTFWRCIDASLARFGVTQEEMPILRENIEKYQDIELHIRDHKLPLNRAISSTYAIKSCDVHLMRNLIYRADPALKERIACRDWEVYDMVTEVNDDITDIYEDLQTYNCNRFLITLLVRGRTKTSREYGTFLNDLGVRAADILVGRQTAEARDLRAWTDRRIVQTRTLLARRIKQINLEAVTGSRLSKALKLTPETG